MSDLLARLKFYKIEHVTEQTKQGILDDIEEAAAEIERLQKLVESKPKKARQPRRQ